MEVDPYADFEAVLHAHARFVDEHEPLDRHAALAALGIDSMGIIELLADIEDRFDVVVPDDAMVPETFETVDSLWQVVESLVVRRAPDR